MANRSERVSNSVSPSVRSKPRRWRSGRTSGADAERHQHGRLPKARRNQERVPDDGQQTIGVRRRLPRPYLVSRRSIEREHLARKGRGEHEVPGDRRSPEVWRLEGSCPQELAGADIERVKLTRAGSQYLIDDGRRANLCGGIDDGHIDHPIGERHWGLARRPSSIKYRLPARVSLTR